jgi:hypothetical protein
LLARIPSPRVLRTSTATSNAHHLHRRIHSPSVAPVSLFCPACSRTLPFARRAGTRSDGGPGLITATRSSSPPEASQQPLQHRLVARRPSPLIKRFLLQISLQIHRVPQQLLSAPPVPAGQVARTLRPQHHLDARATEAASALHCTAHCRSKIKQRRHRASRDGQRPCIGVHSAPDYGLSATVIICSPARLIPTGQAKPLWRRFCFSILAPSDPRLRQHAPSSSPPHSPLSVPVLSIDTYTRPPSPPPDFPRLI